MIRRAFIPVFIILSLLALSLYSSQDKSSEKSIAIKFDNAIRLNGIVFFEIFCKNSPDLPFSMKITNCKFSDSVNLEIPLSSTVIEKNGEIIRGYFFLPNTVPAGKNTLSLLNQSGDSIFSEEIKVSPEIVYHTPLFTKGWPIFWNAVETGMKKIEYTAYSVSEVNFANFDNPTTLFISVKNVENIKVKQQLEISVHGNRIDTINTDENYTRKVYQLSNKEIGMDRWFTVRFVRKGSKGEKTDSFVFEYINQMSTSRLPNWMKQFLKNKE
ncbi:MAG: hypothetical protein JW737_01190 [Acidobacteria bacterium]|nr:hypothetical protein [Acidobacteriota bacterium]